MASESEWLWTLLALLGVSSFGLIGAVTLVLRPRALQRALIVLVAFAAGALLGDAFLHMIPEISESPAGFDITASSGLLAGITGFFLLEKVLHWHHAHMPGEEVLHPVAISNLVGDGIHNFLDGVIIAGAFLISTRLGIATTAAVALHEIPQELGDFGILVHAGLKPRRALVLNLLSGLTAIVGGIVTLLLASGADTTRLLLPFAAGGFIYIASTDLIPELHKEPEPGKSLVQVLSLFFGIAVMAALLLVE
ncbi:MAG: ZIP family metal transporter [Actinobacteria bacterium]|nr:ZIP family metal transporter [Actinomycetota bacterium]